MTSAPGPCPHPSRIRDPQRAFFCLFRRFSTIFSKKVPLPAPVGRFSAMTVGVSDVRPMTLPAGGGRPAIGPMFPGTAAGLAGMHPPVPPFQPARVQPACHTPYARMLGRKRSSALPRPYRLTGRRLRNWLDAARWPVSGRGASLVAGAGGLGLRGNSYHHGDSGAASPDGLLSHPAGSQNRLFHGLHMPCFHCVFFRPTSICI